MITDFDALWQSDSWVQTSIERHRWLRANREEMYVADAQRWFIPRGHLWPLVSVAIHRGYAQGPSGLRISISYKADADSWFVDCTLPRQLVRVLIEMLVELG